MSKEQAEGVARIFSDQLPGVYQMLAATADDFVWDTTTFEGWPEPREYHGFQGFVEFLVKWVEPYDEWRIDVDDIVDAGEAGVVAVLRQTGQIRGSTSQVEMRYGVVYEFQGVKLRRASAYATPQQALEAAGLSE